MAADLGASSQEPYVPRMTPGEQVSGWRLGLALLLLGIGAIVMVVLAITGSRG